MAVALVKVDFMVATVVSTKITNSQETLIIQNPKLGLSLCGNISIPGDKSISHRSIIIPSISNGVCEISNILKSDDVMHTMSAFKNMGVQIEESKQKLFIYGKGLNSLKK